MSIGIKFDGQKADYSLMPFAALDEVVKVLTYGAKKYDRNNWRHVDAIRYQAALMRHFSAYMQGEQCDPETNINHLAHMACSVLFLLAKDLETEVPLAKQSTDSKEYLTETLYNIDNVCYNSTIKS
jgi:hypothetical protein